MQERKMWRLATSVKKWNKIELLEGPKSHTQFLLVYNAGWPVSKRTRVKSIKSPHTLGDNTMGFKFDNPNEVYAYLKRKYGR